MIELLPALTTAITLSNKLKTISDSLKHTELREVIVDLKSQLVNLKEGMLDLTEENNNLKRELAALANAEGDPCPRCKKRTYRLEKSEEHPLFGEIGSLLRTFACDSCQFSEQITVHV